MSEKTFYPETDYQASIEKLSPEELESKLEDEIRDRNALHNLLTSYKLATDIPAAEKELKVSRMTAAIRRAEDRIEAIKELLYEKSA